MPGKGMEVVQNFQEFRVPVWMCYRTHRSSGYCGTGSTELTEVSGTGMNPTELTEVPGRGMRVLQNIQKFRVLWHGHTELRSSGQI